MALLEFRLPDLGEGVTEGEVVEWHVEEGEHVKEDDPMVEVMTDKATVTIGAPRAGVIRELRFPLGEVANVGSVLVVLEFDAPSEALPTAAGEPAATAVGDIREELPGTDFFREKPLAEPTQAVVSSSVGAYFREKPLAAPAVRRLAKERGIDLRLVRPKGPEGRVTRDDVLAFEATSRKPKAPATGPKDDNRRVAFVGLRRQIAQRLEQSARSAVAFTFIEEVDAGPMIRAQVELARSSEAEGVKLTYLAFIAKAVVDALVAHPELNATLDRDANEIVYPPHVHLGVATATDAGLMVPVIRHAQGLGVIDLAREIERISAGARAGTLSPDELRGGTFTLTSLGKRGGLLATPVLNYPEIGICGVHRIKDKPVIRDGAVVPGKLMMLSFTFDHRLVDGHVGAEFAYAIIDALEAL